MIGYTDVKEVRGRGGGRHFVPLPYKMGLTNIVQGVSY